MCFVCCGAFPYFFACPATLNLFDNPVGRPKKTLSNVVKKGMKLNNTEDMAKLG